MTQAPAGLDVPDYEGHCLRAVLPAILDAVGKATVSAGHGSRRDRELIGLPTAPRACLVMLDGLGAELLADRGGHAPFLRTAWQEKATLCSGFPSTTASSLTMLGTGEPPGATGMLGYTVRNPQDGSLLNLISWQDATIEPERWQERPTLVEQLAEPERVLSIGLARFANSGLTRAALRGPRFTGAETIAERVDVAVDALQNSATDLVYLYWGDIDTVGHHHGWQSWQWAEAMSAADAELERLARSLPADTLLVITADHGMVDIPADTRIDVANDMELARDVELVAGEPRASHVHTREGQQEEVRARWQDRLEERAWVLRRSEAISTGLFGQMTPGKAEVVGDLVVIARDELAVLDSRSQTPASMRLVGMHGSLTSAEMRLPLLRMVV